METRREVPENEVEGIAKGLYYDADEHAEFFQKCLAFVKYDSNECITPAHILKVNTDTTNGQPAMVEKLERIVRQQVWHHYYNLGLCLSLLILIQ